MWMIQPSLMCNKHILGEHLECHMFYGCLQKERKLDGYVVRGLLDVEHLKQRHDDLVQEMGRRDMVHKTPIIQEILEVLPSYQKYIKARVNINNSVYELFSRCTSCREKKENNEFDDLITRYKMEKANIDPTIVMCYDTRLIVDSVIVDGCKDDKILEDWLRMSVRRFNPDYYIIQASGWLASKEAVHKTPTKDILDVPLDDRTEVMYQFKVRKINQESVLIKSIFMKVLRRKDKVELVEIDMKNVGNKFVVPW